MKGRSGPEVVVGFIHSSSSLPTHFKKKKVSQIDPPFLSSILSPATFISGIVGLKGPPPQWSGSARSRVA